MDEAASPSLSNLNCINLDLSRKHRDKPSVLLSSWKPASLLWLVSDVSVCVCTRVCVCLLQGGILFSSRHCAQVSIWHLCSHIKATHIKVPRDGKHPTRLVSLGASVTSSDLSYGRHF